MSKTLTPSNDRILIRPIDEGEQTAMSIAYETYRRVYLWDLDEPLSREDFENRLSTDEDFRKTWGPEKN